ncbi:hypothetical protein LEP1GSC116_3449 [Leptospira interrogans serovar Icterohaemorrhagiae str. Verdun HP]|uniref:Uncharacterized protein n=1 Tax=Leptospira interrogans serovar Icterohaemorrhagiae str. Verdun HP TaxID=1049910 RepID=M6R5C6_LEPIR|nr:hypothetical protein LEP1GSC116_3449 [Leptospira interrogans serovar Icterohaemorrhagiae str. Verdun HP]
MKVILDLLYETYFPFIILLFLFETCFPIDPERIRSSHFQDGKYHNIEEDVRLNKNFFRSYVGKF